ncbi:coiled-coil and C2 domain-containing protein 1-like isoform X2 [Toxorhynchites rutilus septentrionalis]|uniref:coiled-coil and C2 domain-containing protein 1-like isoform X2 n=1 Tax=Toxorhynchites rutilus septentrionalis TaxID=329112 RepID=UPI002478A96A|nr:coiled-coil and C2 domain-containing protein 1-like isoform X2 [Toxorhynchites rutilus septentrionalis]
MFSFNKKPVPPKREKKRDPTEFGLFGISDDIGVDVDGNQDDSDDDGDLEAELAAITSGGGSRSRPKPKPKEGIVAPEALDAMVAASLRDIGSDEEVSGDDDDPELLGELAEIAGGAVADDEPELESASPPKKSAPADKGVKDLIKARIEMYSMAEENAKKAGDSGKARRFNRGLKTLKDLQKQTDAGKVVDPSEIPPEVSVKVTNVAPKPDAPKIETPEDVPAVPIRRAPAPPPSDPVPFFESTTSQPPQEQKNESAENPQLKTLTERKNQYKAAAIEAKKQGDTEKAIKFIKIVKQFDVVIQALENGQEVDLSRMPPPPAAFDKPPSTSAPPVVPPPVPPRQSRKEEDHTQKHAEVPTESTDPVAQPQENEAAEEEQDEEVLIQASSVLEALQQRLEKYKSVEKAAKDEANASKARRIGRIVKQYEDAIKQHKAGKPIAVEDLPTPPGYAPIPVDELATPKPVPSPRPEPKVVPVTPPAPGPSKETRSPHTQNDKQIALLLERQKEFRQAALDAKKAGELDEAKEYLRVCKGLDKLLEVARGGIPIDMSTIPIAPSKRSSLEDSFTIVAQEDCTTEDSDLDLRTRMEEQLSKQLIMCKNTRDHHRAMGDVAGTNRFENLALSVQKDLDFVRLAHRKKLPIPKFHYEMKQFNVVKCNTDLTDNEVEVTIARGINYNVPNPKDVDTYVKFEFPYPQDPLKAKTNLVKDTDNPEYNHRQSIEIQRNQRACQRIFKRLALKCEIYSKNGFLRSDTLIGTVTVKLLPLETQCEIHDSFPLMDGRKPVGGKLEVKIRVRNPIQAKQIEQINEKWLIVDA